MTYFADNMSKDKLKTLKDLEIAGHEVVREEAIKWVKELEKSPTKPLVSVKKDILQKKLEETSFKIMIAENQALLIWIIYFFNITEEDLK